MPDKVITNRGIAAVVFIAAVATFAVTVGYEYVWDDPSLVVRAQDALSDGRVTQLFTTSYYVKKVQSARYFRPVMMASLLGDVMLTGGAPWFSHLVNVLIHGINAVLVFSLLNLILTHTHGALAGALLFAVHPVHTEAVAAVSSRMDLLVLLFIFPAVLLWVSPDSKSWHRIHLMWLAASLSFLLACFTKETAFMLPLALIIWQALQRKWPVKEKLIGILLLIAFCAGALLTRAAVFAREASDSTQIKAGALFPDANIATSVKLLMVNLRLPVFPFPGRSQWMGGVFALEAVTILSAAGFVLLAVWAMKRNFIPSAKGLTWWFVFTLPVLGLFNLGQTVAAERYAYIPSVGFCLLFGAVVASLPGNFLEKRPIRVAGTIMVLILGTWGAVHSLPFKNEINLFRYIVRTNPVYPDAHLNLGVALAREGRIEEALRSYEAAEAILPGWSEVAFNRGNLFYRVGRYEEAIKDYQTVLKKDPGDWEAELNLGNVYTALGKTSDAAGSFRRAAGLNSSSGKPLVALGVLALGGGEFERAVHLFEKAAEREPRLSEAFEGMGESYLALGMYDKAEKALLKALEVSPGNARAALKMGLFLLESGRPVQADRAFRTALAAEPFLFEAWVGLIRSLDMRGEHSSADDLVRDLERSDPVLAGKVRDSRLRGPSQKLR